MILKSYPIQELLVSELLLNSVQPVHRTSHSNLSELISVVQKTELLAPVLVARAKSGKYIICDGHRRVETARALGVEKVQAIVLPTTRFTAGQWFGLLNSGIKNMSGVDWFYIWAQSEADALEFQVFPKRQQGYIEAVIAFVGKTYALELGAARAISPGSIKEIQKLANRLRVFGFEKSQTNHIKLSRWWLKHDQAGIARHIEKLYQFNGTSKEGDKLVEKLAACLENDKPLAYQKVDQNTGAKKIKISRPGQWKSKKGEDN